jgi:hypothetical protein
VHLACDQRQEPLSPLVTAGQRGDSPQSRAILERDLHIAAINEWLRPGL